MNKQMLTDILVVLVAPICFIAFYHFFLGNEITTDELLSVSPDGGAMAIPGTEGTELGAKSKQILIELKSINFDESLFSDPVFLSLVDFTPVYATTTVGREYPFSIPDAVRELADRVGTTGGSGKATTTGRASTSGRGATPATAPSR